MGEKLTLDICYWKVSPVWSAKEAGPVVLVTLTSGWPGGSVVGVEEGKLESCHHFPLDIVALSASIIEVGAEEEDR